MSPPAAGRLSFWEWTVTCDLPRAQAVAAEACASLPPTPRTLRGAYRVASVYLEARGRASQAGTVHRVRRYDTEDLVWLETRVEAKQRVDLGRVPLPADLAQSLLETFTSSDSGGHQTSIAGSDFATQVATRGLSPRMLLTFSREEYGLTGTNVSIRIDRDICVRTTNNWVPNGQRGDLEVVPGALIVMTFDDHPPAHFRRLLRTHELTTGPLSRCFHAREKLLGIAG